jgi:hypothetical protein
MNTNQPKTNLDKLLELINDSYRLSDSAWEIKYGEGVSYKDVARALIEAERKDAVEDYRCNVTQGILSRTQDNVELTEFINKIDSEYLKQKQEENEQTTK